MNHGNSGLAHGTGGSPQLTLDNGDMAVKAKENEASITGEKDVITSRKEPIFSKSGHVTYARACEIKQQMSEEYEAGMDCEAMVVE